MKNLSPINENEDIVNKEYIEGSYTKTEDLGANAFTDTTIPTVTSTTVTDGTNTLDISGKANDSAVVHLANAETITGVKTYTNRPILSQSSSSLPSEYQEVTYIQSSGTQYINTGVTPTSSMSYEVKFTYLQPGFVFGARTSSSANNTGLTLEQMTPVTFKGRVGNTVIITTSDVQVASVYTVILASGNSSVYNNTTSVSVTTSSTTGGSNFGNLPIYLFTVNNNGSMGQSGYSVNRIYNFKIKNGDTVLYNFVPCYEKSTDTIGMYDTVNSVFYDNDGSGVFEKGSDVGSTSNFAVLSDLPTKTSELTNDSDFITKDVNNLTNYTKTSDLGSNAFTSTIIPTVSSSGVTDGTNTYNASDKEPKDIDLKLDGSNTMTGVLNLKASGANEGNIGDNGIRWSTTSLPQDSEIKYVCTINAFADGGRQKWCNIANLKSKLGVPSVVNNVTSTSTTNALSANMGKELQTQISNLQNIGRFLAIWDASTGTPTSEPTTSPYTYKVGDYYRVGVAGTKNPATNLTYVIGGTNYVEGSSLSLGDVVYCSNVTSSATTWAVQESSGGGTVQDVQVNGTSVLSGGIASVTVPNVSLTTTVGSEGITVDSTSLTTVTRDTTQTISGAKTFTGTVGNAQSSAGIYLGLDSASSPNANISIVSSNSASYIDMGRPSVDYDFRIIKWSGTKSNNAQMIYGGNASGTITIPQKSGTMALTSDIPSTYVSTVNGNSGAITNIATTSDLASYMPLSGSTFTGVVKFNELNGACINYNSEFYIGKTNGETLLGTNGTLAWVGTLDYGLTMRGSATRPTYNGGSLALYSDIPTVPTTLSSFTDDLGSSPTHTHSQYLTSHQDISGKANLSGATFTGAVTVPSLSITGAFTALGSVGGGFSISDTTNVGMELGRRDGTAGTPYFDFHTDGSSSTDYNSRLLASGSGLYFTASGGVYVNNSRVSTASFSLSGTTLTITN